MMFYNLGDRNFETDFSIDNTLSYGFSDCIRIHLTYLQFSVSCILIWSEQEYALINRRQGPNGEIFALMFKVYGPNAVRN